MYPNFCYYLILRICLYLFTRLITKIYVPKVVILWVLFTVLPTLP